MVEGFEEFISTAQQNIKDNNISNLNTILTNISNMQAFSMIQNDYKTNIQNISSQFTNAFITTWETDDDNITIPINSDYQYNYTVDWGDGNIDTNITGYFPAMRMVANDSPWLGTNDESNNAKKLKEVTQWGNIEFQSMQNMFAYTYYFN